MLAYYIILCYNEKLQWYALAKSAYFKEGVI